MSKNHKDDIDDSSDSDEEPSVPSFSNTNSRTQTNGHALGGMGMF